jgi:hypothetical protein
MRSKLLFKMIAGHWPALGLAAQLLLLAGSRNSTISGTVQ